jgi:hypothetical protein
MEKRLSLEVKIERCDSGTPIPGRSSPGFKLTVSSLAFGSPRVAESLWLLIGMANCESLIVKTLSSYPLLNAASQRWMWRYFPTKNSSWSELFLVKSRSTIQ